MPGPARGEVTIRIQAAGINPADLKHAAAATSFPRPLGYEIAGEIIAVGPDTEIASGPVAEGDAVLAFRVYGGFAEAMTVPASDVFARPASLSTVEAATLLLAATTASEMLHVVRAQAGDVVVVHGASGAVGLAAIQLGVRAGVRMLGVCGEHGASAVREAGAEVIVRSDSLLQDLAAYDITAALDCVGTDQAVDVSLQLVADRSRVVTIAAHARAQAEGFRRIQGAIPESAAYRNSVRAELIALAAAGELRIPVAGTMALENAREALALVAAGRSGGKIALVV